MPTVTSFTSQFAQFEDGTNPVDIRPFSGKLCLQLGGIDQVTNDPVKGIEWTANVTPSSYAGGQIAFVQLVDAYGLQKTASQKLYKQSANGTYYLDDSFPYSNIVSIGSELKDSDSPDFPLGTSIISVTTLDKFKTYLMYKPSGSGSIWVSLSLIEWAWGGKVDRQSNGDWNPDPSMFPQPFLLSASTATTVLPVWSGRVQDIPWKEVK